MSYLHQAETNVAAHRMSSAEEAKWRDWDVDPELLYDQSAVETTLEQPQYNVQRPLSADAASKVMQAAEVYTHNPATAAVNLSFNTGRF
jgi:hypothetical protein